MVLLAPPVTALQTLGGISRICWTTWHCTQHNENSMYSSWSDQWNHRVGTQQESGSEMRNLALSRSFVTLEMSWLRMLVRKFSVAPTEAKIQLFKSKCYPIYGSYQNSVWKLTVSYSDTFKRLINVPIYTSSSLAFAMNATDHISVVFSKSAYSLMSRVTASPNSVVTAIVNSDAYQQSPLMDKFESMLYV